MTVVVARVPLVAFASGLGNGDRYTYCGSDEPKIRRRDVYSP
jgi:hypothetical protein